MSLPGDKYRSEIPEQYFNKLNGELEIKLLEEEIFNEQDYPFLFGLNDRQDFTIPPNYLNQFDPSIYYTARKNAFKFQSMTIAIATLIAIAIFALSIKTITPENEEIKSEEILQYFAIETIAFDDLSDGDLEGFLSAETEISFTDIENEILFDFLNEDTDQINLEWFY